MVFKSGTIRLGILVLGSSICDIWFIHITLVQVDRFGFGFVEYESQQSMQAAIEVSLLLFILSVTDTL